VIADESHFLKNAQAKRTTASLPVIKVFTHFKRTITYIPISKFHVKQTQKTYKEKIKDEGRELNGYLDRRTRKNKSIGSTEAYEKGLVLCTLVPLLP